MLRNRRRAHGVRAQRAKVFPRQAGIALRSERSAQPVLPAALSLVADVIDLDAVVGELVPEVVLQVLPFRLFRGPDRFPLGLIPGQSRSPNDLLHF